MNKTLGLDLGSNSLGWAVLDDLTGNILNKGVVVFPEGIDAANDTLETPAAIRRAARMGRRMKFRRKMRKWVLLKVLIDNKMCPMTHAELEEWKKTGKYPIGNKAFIEWLKSTDVTNPYMDRASAASGTVEKFVLGRALYHICQRRGFKSSRKEKIDTGDEKADAKENKKRSGKVSGDIEALNKEIVDAGCRTLGQYFAKVIESQKDSLEKRRIRCRYTGRIVHYEVEFAEIMKAQKIDSNSDLFKTLHKAIFLQRPLRSQKHLVGYCPLEPKSPRCRISHPAYEEFRMLAFVNNLSFEKVDVDGNGTGEKIPLTAEERAAVCKVFYKASPTIKFAEIAKIFKKRFKDESLRFYYYRDDEAVASCQTRHRIVKAFGEVKYDEQKVFDALCFYNDDDKLVAWFKKHYSALGDEQIAALIRISPKEGNAKYSLKAINKMLPYLRKGFNLFEARNLAKITDLLPNIAEKDIETISIHLQELRLKNKQLREEYDSTKGMKTTQPPLLVEMYHDYLRDEWGVDEESWQKYLRYYQGDAVYSIDPKKPNRLPEVKLGMIRNPLVQRSMTTLRRLVNYLRDHEIIDGETTIRIELARNVNDFATRHAIQAWQKQNQLEREEARIEIVKLKIEPTEDAIDRYILCKEQDWKCLYTGKTINLSDALSGNKFDIEHTIPRSRSGDDSLANKTLCDATYNRQVKQGKIPTECVEWDEIDVRLAAWKKKVEELGKVAQRQLNAAKMLSDPTSKSQSKTKALVTKMELNYWRDKLRRFTITSDRLTDSKEGLSGFKKRQLVDTGIMCSHAVEFLRSVYPQTYAVNGTATAFARKAWGVQTDAVKDRTNHTHHAKDAMVIAALTPARFNAICTALKDDGSMVGRRECDVCPAPYENFAEKVRKACDEILVKHVLRQTTLKQSSKRNCLAKSHPSKKDPKKKVSAVLSRGDTVRGQLHKETFYGCIMNPDSGKKEFVVRKPLVGAKIAEALKIAESIVDAKIREIVINRLNELQVEGIKSVEAGAIKMPSGVPVNKVRIVAHTTNPAELREHAMPSKKSYKTPYYVTSAEGSNFRLALFNLGGKYSVEPDNSLTWAKNHKKHDYLPLGKKDGFVGYITPGSLALTYDRSADELKAMMPNDLVKRLYKVVKFESTGRITFRYHSEARAAVDLAKELAECGKHKAGESCIDYVKPHELLLLSPSRYCESMVFEGIHFKMMLDGTIKFLK